MKANGRRPTGRFRRGIAAGIALTGAFVTGCNLLTGAADLSVDGTDVVPGPDGGLTSPDARVTPGADASRTDAAGDAGLDAAVPAPPCSSDMVFCDDFDDGTLAKWGVVKLGGSNAVIDQLAATSAPSSLLSRRRLRRTRPAPSSRRRSARRRGTCGSRRP